MFNLSPLSDLCNMSIPFLLWLCCFTTDEKRAGMFWVHIHTTFNGLRQFLFYFRDPYGSSDDEDDEPDDDVLKPMKVSIDLDLSAHANARK